MHNVLLLVAEAVVYFLVMSILFRLRQRLGIGVFFCALGTMHFLETYLAGVFYVAVGGVLLSPGSTVLFSGKLVLLLVVYVKENAVVVRQPIYGLFVGNAIIVGLVTLLRLHEVQLLPSGRVVDLPFIDEMGWLMVWGTLLLFVDSILMILVYERLGRWLGRWTTLRLLISAALILSFDQLGFYLVLYVLVDAPASILLGGWLAKMGAALLFSLLAGAYLRWGEGEPDLPRPAPRIGDVLDVLTYRRRYERLLQRAGRDGLTGLLDRGTLETEGAAMIGDAVRAGRPVSLIVLDLDRFKAINDRHGHLAGDAVLRCVAGAISRSVRAADRVFRYGGEEFVVVCRSMDLAEAAALAGRIRAAILKDGIEGIPEGVTVSAGVSAAPADGSDLKGLFEAADRRLYKAKATGRDRVVAVDGAAAD
jgi:diguanylate cyclase (GGDEF)-like protein